MDVVNNRRATFKKILNVTSGNFLEQYDFFLFGFYATYIAAKFFHSDNEYVSLMMTFTVFAAGFLCALLALFSWVPMSTELVAVKG